MPCRCHNTRRDLLRWSALIAAAPLVACSDRDESVARATAAATTAGVDPRTVSPVNLELVTLTETSAVITWYTGVPGTDDGTKRMVPKPADGQVSYGTSPSRLTMTAHDEGGPTPYHYVELTGLEPGQTYYYRAASAGKPATPTPLPLVNGNAAGTAAPAGADGPFTFTTPQPPPGRHLFSIALCNDLHLGETVAGLVGGTSIKGLSQQPGLRPYPEVMAEGLVAEATARGANYLLAAGDLSSEAAPPTSPGSGRSSTVSAPTGRTTSSPAATTTGRTPARPTPAAAPASGRATTASATTSSRARRRRTSPTTSTACTWSGSTRTTRRATAATPVGCPPPSSHG